MQFPPIFHTVLTLAQCFATMPVQGIKGKSAKDLHFTWKSFRTFYCFVVFGMICLNAVCAAFWLLNERITFIRIGKRLSSTDFDKRNDLMSKRFDCRPLKVLTLSFLVESLTDIVSYELSFLLTNFQFRLL